MATCQRCTAINFDDGCLYALGSVSFMTKSALAGCPGCKFFLGVFRVTHDEEQAANNSNETGSNDDEVQEPDEGAGQDPDGDTDESLKCDIEKNPRIEQQPELQVLLQRYNSDSNRVDMNFMSEGPAFDVVHYVQLRLCTAYGKQF
jgi:hypothetical protein